ncbi:hypothetical protein [Lacticaseibacillus suilingensis]|uniref:hypothetical protein n=1 Tax=Lacticaseibacillus suilingensis TaxID=2799577 RepID=UPI0022E2A609|nr:hypothetical protein [Lacticaseibacillus suilingensis]
MENSVIVSIYKFEDKTWTNFEAVPIKKYECSVLLDISNSQEFTTKEKVELNNCIVVSMKKIKNKSKLSETPQFIKHVYGPKSNQ